MRELPITTRAVRTEGNRRMTLQYVILVEESPEEVEHYGVKVTELETGESASALTLTTRVPKIYGLVEKLAENAVTPTGLMDVLADWL